MGYLRNWFEAAFTTDILPSPYVKYLLLVLGALAGGWIFAMTGSWIYAIASYGIAYLWLRWGVVPFVEWLGERIVRVALFFLP